jgi:leader peptidase (prepilin peptidase) / N-methyltransferase
LLICVFWIDADWKLIPDTFSLGGAAYGLLISLLPGTPLTFSESLWGFGIGFGLFFLLAIGYEKATGRVGLGGGDIKLLGMIGVFLGTSGVLTTLLISSVAGSIYGLLKSKWTKSPNAMIEPIAYGPFLVLGALADYFLRGTEWLTWILPF